MHLPPPAQWRHGRSRAHAALLTLAAASYAVLLFFLWHQVDPAAWSGLFVLALVLLLHASWRWWKSPVGVLRWTGREWHWLQSQAVPAAQVCAVRWMLDLQTVALVHAAPQSGSGANRWLWLERGAQSAAAWMALRRAMLANANANANAAAQETLLAQTAVIDGATFFSNNYLTGPQMPQLELVGVCATPSAGPNGFQDSTLR